MIKLLIHIHFYSFAEYYLVEPLDLNHFSSEYVTLIATTKIKERNLRMAMVAVKTHLNILPRIDSYDQSKKEYEERLCLLKV